MPTHIKQLQSLSPEQWRMLAFKHAPLAVCALATIGIAWQASQLTWLLAAKPKVIVSPATNPTTASRPAKASVDVQSIANAHLFGSPTANTEADPRNLPPTQMGLVLAGTMALNDPAQGYAIVGENAANAKFYRVGEMIGGSARLHSVYADRVILDRGGRLEILALPSGSPSTAVVAARPTPAANNVGDNLRRLAQTNPSALGELLRAQPVFAGGAQKGYRVYPGRDRQQFVRLGLQPGDLITSVNGTALDDPSRSNDILNTLTASSSVAVTVERNGATRQLTLDMAQLSLPDVESTAPTAAADSSTTTGPAATEAPPAAGPDSGPSGARGNRGFGPRNGGAGTPPSNSGAPAPGGPSTE